VATERVPYLALLSLQTSGMRSPSNTLPIAVFATKQHHRRPCAARQDFLPFQIKTASRWQIHSHPGCVEQLAG
jgi:hypothetical protein